MIKNTYYLKIGSNEMTSAFDIGYREYLKEWSEEKEEFRPKHPDNIKRKILIVEGRRVAENDPDYTELKYN